MSFYQPQHTPTVTKVRFSVHIEFPGFSENWATMMHYIGEAQVSVFEDSEDVDINVEVLNIWAAVNPTTDTPLSAYEKIDTADMPVRSSTMSPYYKAAIDEIERVCYEHSTLEEPKEIELPELETLKAV